MITYLHKTGVILIAVITLPAWAGNGQAPYPVSVYDNSLYDYAKVLSVQPVTEVVQVPQERQVCREEAVQHRVAERRSPAPVVFGAILGGVIGNQLSRGNGRRHGHGHGHGHNRAAATAAGAAIGGVIASEVQYSKYPPRYYTVLEQRCYQQTDWLNEERIVAWDVEWRYQGKTYHSRMTEPPGDRIPVRVSVDPVYP